MLYYLANTYIGHISLLDALVIVFYTLACFAIGLKNYAASKNMNNYVLGGNISTAALVAIIYASYLVSYKLATIELLLAIAALTALFSPVKWVISIYFFSKNIGQFRGCITLGDVMHRLYDRSGRIIACITLVFVNILSVAVQILVLGYLLNHFLDISITYSVILGFGTLIFYLGLGGRKSIVITDPLKFAIFYIIIPIVVALILYEVGDLRSIEYLLPAEKWQQELAIKNSNWIFLSAIIYAFLPAATGIMIQRFFIAMKTKQLYKAFIAISLVTFAVMIFISIFDFIMGVGIEGHIATSNVIGNIIASALPILIKGFAVIGVIAIIISTADSYINVTGVLVARDIVKNLFPEISDRTEVIIAQSSALFAIILSAVFALKGDGALQLIWSAVTFYASIIAVPIIAGFFRFRTNSISFLGSVIGALIGILIGYAIQQPFNFLDMILGLIGSGVALFFTHYMQVHLGILNNVSKPGEICISNWHEEIAHELGITVEEVISKLGQFEERDIRHQQRFWARIRLFIRGVYRTLLEFRLSNILQFCYAGVSSSPPQYYQFAAFGLFYAMYPMLFFEISIAKLPFAEEQPLWLIEIVLRVLAGLVCIGIGLYDMWNNKVNIKYFPLYWYLAVTFCLPVVGIYSYLVEPNENSVLMGTVLGIFALAAFVDWMRFWVISLLGFIISNILYCVFSILSDEDIYYGHDVISGYTIYLFAAIAMAFLVRYAQQREVQTIKIFSGAIAHEVKSPVASAYTAISTLLNVLNKAKVSKPKTDKQGNKIRHISMYESDYSLLEYISHNVKTLLSRGMKSSEIMLMALSGINRAQDLSVYPVNGVIHKVLDNYGLTEEEKMRIKFDDSHDFNFYGSSNLLSNVLYNLLGNALKYAGSDVKIEIWTAGNSIYFKDYGKGINAEDLPHIFDLFYTKEKGGTGIGLALCKNIITLMGGEIFCSSAEGQFTEFTIVFPPVKNSK